MLKKIITSSFIIYIGTMITRAAVFVFNIYVARVISLEQYGQYSIIRFTMSTLTNMINGSFSIAITKNIAEKQKDKYNFKEYILYIIIVMLFLVIFLCSILWFFSDIFVEEFLLNNININMGFKIGVIMLFFSLLSSILQAILMGIQEFKIVALTNIFSSIVFLPIGIILTKKLNFFGAISSMVVFFLLLVIFQFIYLKTSNLIIFKKIYWIKIKKIIVRLYSFSIPLAFSSILTLFLFWYARVLYLNTTHNFSDIANFDVAYQLISIIMIATGSLTSIALPLFSTKNNIESNYILKITFTINVIFSVVVSFVIMLNSQVVILLYGKDYIESAKILNILIFISVFFSSSSILNKYIISKGKVWQSFICIIVASLFFISVLLNTIADYQIYSLVYSFLSYYILLSLLYILYIIVFIQKKE